MKKETITERITKAAFELLVEHKDGVRWSQLLKGIKEKDPSLHPKTVNGFVWKLVEKYPDKVYKPSKGIFRLLKYKFAAKSNKKERVLR